MTEAEYKRLKKAFVDQALNGQPEGLKNLVILEKSYTDQLNNEQVRSIKANELALKCQAQSAEELRKQNKDKQDAEELELKHQNEEKDRAAADALAKEERERKERLEKLEKKTKIWGIIGTVFGGLAGVGGSIAVATINNKHREREIEALTKFEQDGTPASFTSKEVFKNNLK